MVKRALLIGINYYGTESQLNGCINDVKNVKKLLLNKYNFKKQDIVMLNDNKETHVDYQPTATNIITGMKCLVAYSQPGDTLFMHYSGHGSYITDTSGDEEDGRDETICPVDYDTAGMISDDTINKYLCSQVPTGVKLIAFMDCCHSSSNLDIKYVYKSDDTPTGTMTKIYENKRVKETKGQVIMISGCKDDQTSSDAYLSGQYQGALTSSLIHVLSKSPNERYSRLLNKVRKYMSNHRFTQIPQLTSGRPLELTKRFEL